MLLPIDAATRSESLRDQLVTTFTALPAQLRSSITWDQGWEMARHAEIAEATGATGYFCDPHAPWQRGSNESTNRLLRDYSPRAPTSASTPRNNSPRSRWSSTPAPEKFPARTPPPHPLRYAVMSREIGDSSAYGHR
jgi:hypothetical protein